FGLRRATSGLCDVCPHKAADIEAEALAEGGIEAGDAALIGDTRLGGMSLAEAASLLGMAVDSVRHRRRRAEARVVAWLGGPPMPRATGAGSARPDADRRPSPESSPSSGVRFRAPTPYLGVFRHECG
ncbi:MAG: hypothetical protein M0Z42_12425, partial [Actinomycetota bacterium]|nr:hypothetical protein [Actinomycetota bacterium]